MIAAERAGLDPEAALRIARAWAGRGRTAAAIASYDDVLVSRPGFREAFQEVVALLEADGDWAGIAERCERWIHHHPDHASHAYSDQVHNTRITALVHIGGLDRAFETYGLELLRPSRFDLQPDDVVATIVARNQSLRMPDVLAHHRRLGVDRFLIVDNASDDGMTELVLDQPDTVVWRTADSFAGANHGVAWVDCVFRRYITTQWCLLVDADELFVYPDYERRAIKDLCAELDEEGATAYGALMVDMYGEGPIAACEYHAGDRLIEVCPYFDRTYYEVRRPFDGPRRNITNYWGGVRSRVFPGPIGSYLLNKMPLFRYQHGELLMSGNHWHDRHTEEIASGRGALLHFKLLSDLPGVATEEAERKQHAASGAAYLRYENVLDEHATLIPYDPLHSTRFQDSVQLTEIGIMRRAGPDERTRVDRSTVIIPEIPPVPDSTHRPDWSLVMIADRRREVTQARLAHALEQLGRLDDGLVTEIDLVWIAGRADPITERMVPAPDSTRINVRLFETGRALALVGLLNFGLACTRGRWIHVVEAADRAALRAHVLLRHALATTDVSADIAMLGVPGTECWAIDLALADPMFAAERKLYEKAGGFCATAGAARAWELLQRLASRRRAAPLVVPGDNAVPRGEPIGFGEDVIDWLAAVDLAEADGLDSDRVAALHDECARRAGELARLDVGAGRFASALATVTEALRAPISPGAHAGLVRAMTETMR